MFRHTFLLCIISVPFLLFLACQTEAQTGIPDRIGDWRVDVGPPGNEFYEEPAPAGRASPPSQAMFDLVKRIAPDHRTKRVHQR